MKKITDPKSSVIAMMLTLLGVDVASADVWTFSTPSENIQCSVGVGASSSDMICEIIARRGTAALPKPTNCGSDWGHVFVMRDTGTVKMECGPAEDAGPGQHILEYGTDETFDGFRCKSSTKGLECRNRDENGFFLSRREQIVFNDQSDNQATASAASNQGCLNLEIDGDVYPVAREKLIVAGWKPKPFSPAFELAAYADWVQTRNYTEVEACAGTGTAPCKFIFKSTNDQSLELAVFTQGEDIGIVTGHQCVRSGEETTQANAQNVVADLNEPRVATRSVTTRWRRDPWGDLYSAKSVDYEKGFELRINCASAENPFDLNSIYLLMGQDDFTGTATFSFERGGRYEFAFENGFFGIDTQRKVSQFRSLVSELKSENHVTVVTEFGDGVKAGLRGSSKAIGQCPIRRLVAADRDKNVETQIALSPSNSDVTADEINRVSERIQKTLPTGAIDIIDYRLSACSGIRGFGGLTYSNSGRTVLTDFCLDESTGEFLSAEPLSGLELTADSRNGRKFEDLSSGSSFYERNHVQIIPDENIPGCTPEPIESVHASIQSPKSQDIPGQNFGHMIGYTHANTAPIPGVSRAKILLGFRSVAPDPSKAATFRTIPSAQGDLLATAVFEEGKGTITVTEGGGHTYGNANGSFSLSFPGDGTFTLTGSFSAQSLRIKGHEANEMIRTQGDILHFRGHVQGSDGSGLVGYGIAEGEVTDASGKTHDYQAKAYLLSCTK